MEPRLVLTLAALWLVVLAVALWLFVRPRLRRKRVDAMPFPPRWLPVLKRSLSFYENLPAEYQAQLRRLMMRFLDSKQFVGCAGQTVDDDMRIAVAAHACLLLLNRPTHEYQDLRYILLYPTEFLVKHDEHDDESGLVTKTEDVLSGESWTTGKVILAWDSVLQSLDNPNDGENVILHEFAHQLDHESGSTNGTPLLYSKEDYERWEEVFTREFEALQADIEQDLPTFLDPYGATDPSEFFAVVTETFYELPHEMALEHPELFEQLQSYFRVDPRAWHSRPAAKGA